MSLRGREEDPLGGNSLSGGASLDSSDVTVAWNIPQGNVRGVYGLNPVMTPKYHTGSSKAGALDSSLDKMARMFISFPSKPSALRKKFISSVGGDAKRFAEAMATTGNKQAGGGMGYIDFFMTQANESFAENMQIAQVLSDNYVSYFFGRTPPVFRYNGILLNTVQDDWRTAMWIIYNNLIRGTQMARRKAAVTLAYDSVAVTGVITNMTEILQAENELAVPFSFGLLVKRFDIIKPPLFGPTPSPFPSRITPDSFASTVIESAQVSRRAVLNPSMQTEQREGASDEEVAETEPVFGVSGDTYNSVSEQMRAKAQAVNIFTGVFGTASEGLINTVADDINSPAS